MHSQEQKFPPSHSSDQFTQPCIIVKDLDTGRPQRVDPTQLTQLSLIQSVKHSHWESYWEEQKNLEQELLRLVTQNKIAQLRDGLVSHPVDINKYIYMDGWSLLHHATSKGFYNIAVLLLLEGIDKNKKTTDMKNTALHLSVLNNQEEITQLLVSQGADPNLTNADFCTPLHYTADYGYYSIAKIILTKSEVLVDINIKNNSGMTVLDCCRSEKMIGLINEYIERHEKLKIIENQDQYKMRMVQMENGTLMKVKSRVDHVESLLYLVSSKKNSSPPEQQEVRKNYSLVGSKIDKGRLQYLQKIAKKSVNSYRDLLNNFNVESLKDYDRIRKIGEGAFGEVYLARKKNSSKLFAIKTLAKFKIKKQKLQRYVYAEQDILKNIKHPFIMHGQSFFQDSSYLYIVMEFCQGSDLEKKVREKPFPQQIAKKYVCQVLLAVEELHRNKILFRDLKSSNILIDSFGHVKVSDFGLAKKSQLSNSFLGSYAYLAPQMLAEGDERIHDFTIDWYLLGVFLYELLTGLPPFFNQNKALMYRQIRDREPSYPENISKQCKDLLQKLLLKSPKKRLGRNGVDEIKNHNWFSDINWKNVLEKKLQLPVPQVNQKQLRRKGFIEEEYIDPYDQNVFADWDYCEVQKQK